LDGYFDNADGASEFGSGCAAAHLLCQTLRSNVMFNGSSIYEEDRILTAKYCDRRSTDYLHYNAKTTIKATGKKRIEMSLVFSGTPPFAAPMPPCEHTINAECILDLYSKLMKWFRKWGYEIQ